MSRINEGLICGTSRISLPTTCSKSFSRSWRCNTAFLTVFQTEILMLVDTVLVLLEIHTVTSTKASGQNTKPTSFMNMKEVLILLIPSNMIPPGAICCPQRVYGTTFRKYASMILESVVTLLCLFAQHVSKFCLD